MNTSNSPKVSVIIPVYKAEKYIQRCAESLFNQTMQNVEYIFIDDNSPDNSLKIVQDLLVEYPNRVKNTKLLKNAINLGVGSTRQVGLDNAKGEYVIHCDPDDWVDSQMLDNLYNVARSKNADVVWCDMLYEYKQKTILTKSKVEGLNNTLLIEKLLTGEIHGSLCNKLVKSEYIFSNKIDFIKGLNFCEDMTFCIKLFMGSANVVYHPHAYYHYDKVSNDNSLTSVNTHYAKEQYFIWTNAFNSIIGNQVSINYRTGTAFIAYWAFVHDLFTTKEYRDLYRNKVHVLLFNKREFKVKFFTVLSALGLKHIMYNAYKRLKHKDN